MNEINPIDQVDEIPISNPFSLILMEYGKQRVQRLWIDQNTRKTTLSIRGDMYLKLKQTCKNSGLSMSFLIDYLIRRNVSLDTLQQEIDRNLPILKKTDTLEVPMSSGKPLE